MKKERSDTYLKITVFCAVFILLFAAALMPTGEEAEIYDDVIRLHVRAASDGVFDTAVKMIVKDAVLEEISAVFAENAVGGDTAPERRESAEKLISENIGRIENAALKAAGRLNAGNVSAELTTARFPEKTYGDITLPAGRYRTVNVTVGDGGGHNWWCVVYPVICLSPSSPAVTLRETGFTNDQISVLQGGSGYVIKFKLLELINGIFG